MSDQDKPADEVQDGEQHEVIDDPGRQVAVSAPRDPAVDRAVISKVLIGMMAVGLVMHYVAVVAFEWTGKHESVKSLETVLNAWLPILSGLVGAAVTYYFTREKS